MSPGTAGGRSLSGAVWVRALIDWADLTAGEVLRLARPIAAELIAAGIVAEVDEPKRRRS